MATFTKFRPFVANLAHGLFDFSADTLKVALCESVSAPVNTNGEWADLTVKSVANLTSVTLAVASEGQTAGTYKLVITDKVLTATGDVGPFEYVVVYDDTATAKNLIGFFDYGSDITLHNGESLTLDFDGTNGLLQLA